MTAPGAVTAMKKLFVVGQGFHQLAQVFDPSQGVQIGLCGGNYWYIAALEVVSDYIFLIGSGGLSACYTNNTVINYYHPSKFPINNANFGIRSVLYVPSTNMILFSGPFSVIMIINWPTFDPVGSLNGTSPYSLALLPNGGVASADGTR